VQEETVNNVTTRFVEVSYGETVDDASINGDEFSLSVAGVSIARR